MKFFSKLFPSDYFKVKSDILILRHHRKHCIKKSCNICSKNEIKKIVHTNYTSLDT